jgi:hypothetical protein
MFDDIICLLSKLCGNNGGYVIVDILKYIEELREELNTIFDDMENCDRDKLLEISQKLDRALLVYIDGKG